jgi:diguanylate cyclase (GGDEF)-like protein
MKSTEFRLTLSLLISINCIVIVFSFFSYRQSVRILEEESSKASLQTIIQTGRHIENMLQRYKDFANTLAHDQDLLNKMAVLSNLDDPSGYESAVGPLTSLLTSYSNSNKTVEAITVFSSDQSRVVSSLSRESILPAMRSSNAEAVKKTDWFQTILSSSEDTIFLDTRKNAFLGKNAAKPVFAVARVVRSPFNHRRVLGTIVIEISTDNLEKALGGIQLGTDGSYAIVSNLGSVVYSVDERRIETRYSGTIPEPRSKGSGVYSGRFYAKDEAGMMQNYLFQQSELSGWYMIGYNPKEELVAPVKRMLWNVAGIALLCSLAAAVCVGFLVQKGVGGPLRKLRLLMQEGEKGNLNVRTDVHIGSEIGEMGYAFNRMSDQITLAYYDTLTNLPNRRLLVDRMEAALSHAKADEGQLAVLFVDLDRFKVVNDSLGHHAGDLLIQLVGKRLQTCICDGDTVARIAGDEFVILLPEVSDKDLPVKLAERVLDTLRAPFAIFEHDVHISGSIGIAYYPEDGADAETLIKCADMAMYEAKAKGKNNFKLYDLYMTVRSNERMMIENDLHRALANEEFQLYYQPRVDAKTGKVLSTEALLRWNHMKLGMIPPDKFIPVAEETGIIVPLGQWVLREACKQNKAWQDAGLPSMRIAVNVSAKQFGKDLVESICRILEDTGLDAQWLEIEITESLLIENEKTIVETLRKLKSMNIHISIDDFGTGYSNLAYLLKFEVDCLKLDKSFIRDIHCNAENQMIATAVMGLAHSLGMSVVSEGVETKEEYDFLLERGTDELQGFYISKPVPGDIYEQVVLKKVKLKLA